MRIGKITQTAWQRYVKKQLHTERTETLFQASPWECCSGIGGVDLSGAETGSAFLWADAHVSGKSPRIGYYAAFHAAGELAAKGADLCGISAYILLPSCAEEKELRELTAGLVEACERLGAQITALRGEVSPVVRENVVFVTGTGLVKIRENSSPVRKCSEEGRKDRGTHEILLCGYAGLEGTLRILDEAEEELGTRFVASFLSQTRTLKEALVTPEQLLSVGKTAAVPAVRQIGSGGILAALWELGEILDTGMEVDMSAIALKQETVEICEFYRLNPYQMTSAGSFLIATDEAEAVIEVLEKAGARAGRLGVTKAQNARVITSGEEIRYLDRPAPDELARWTAERAGAQSVESLAELCLRNSKIESNILSGGMKNE